MLKYEGIHEMLCQNVQPDVEEKVSSLRTWGENCPTNVDVEIVPTEIEYL
jgi:hypothetical protein